ncbi:uncharacterized protein KGF55_002661 [Candida pseudojiufengensis]|uniref:uncharacterized protein n=1 Tax=Candida pseudojiufengensis TaxID=497109 RepID=UPI002225AB05|nr:uncharacterized protein KGF55_002661 [Candida pseudojiufengensis]KAI5963781.1 hypothetical protein KGF55_002661 [Candida pseudojiufengensis]
MDQTPSMPGAALIPASETSNIALRNITNREQRYNKRLLRASSTSIRANASNLALGSNGVTLVQGDQSVSTSSVSNSAESNGNVLNGTVSNSRDPTTGLYHCQIPGCVKRYNSKGSLRLHNLSHGDRTYQCSTCDKSFYNHNALREHQKIHTRRTKTSCTHNGCSKTFTNPKSLTQHIKDVHERHTWTCKICNRAFQTFNDRRYHMRSHKTFASLPSEKVASSPHKINVYSSILTSFYINLPIGGFALLVFLFSFRPPAPKGDYFKQLKEFDYIGLVLMIGGITVFMLALTFGSSNHSWNSAAVIACFVVGIVVTILFGIWNFRYSKNQILGTDIVIIPQIIASTVCLSGVFSSFIVTMIYGSVYFQVIRDSSAMGAGLHLLPCIISVVVSSIVSGVSIQKLRFIKPWNVLSGILAPVGAGLCSLLQVDSSFSQQVGFLILTGVAAGTQMQPAIISAQIKAPKTPGGTIMTTVFINTMRSLVSAIAATLSDAVYTSSLKNNFKSALPQASPDIQQTLAKINLSSILSSNTILKELDPASQLFIKQQMVKAIHNVFYMCIGWSALTTISCVFITNQKLPDMVAMEKKKEEEVKQLEENNQENAVNDENTSDESKAVNDHNSISSLSDGVNESEKVKGIDDK